MKTTQILALPAIAAASMLVLTGCIQMPPAGGGTPQEDPGSGAEAQSLEGTSWAGAIDGVVDPLEFTLNADGTVDIAVWGSADQSYDAASDVWEGDTSEVTITITGVEEGAFDVTFTGPAADGQMNLTGEGTDGSSHTLTATQG
jgi:FlaG/FlaF family flagellin (archaellin)